VAPAAKGKGHGGQLGAASGSQRLSRLGLAGSLAGSGGMRRLTGTVSAAMLYGFAGWGRREETLEGHGTGCSDGGGDELRGWMGQGLAVAAMGAPAMALAAERRRRMEREWGGK